MAQRPKRPLSTTCPHGQNWRRPGERLLSTNEYSVYFNNDNKYESSVTYDSNDAC